MELNLNSLILLPIFIILLVVIFRVFKDSLKFEIVPSVILSICASALATLALNGHTKGTVGIVLIPYATLGIPILLAVLIAFLFKTIKKPEGEFPSRSEKNSHYDINEKRRYKIDDDRIKR
jgi:predicted RND superfamily exporter protein